MLVAGFLVILLRSEAVTVVPLEAPRVIIGTDEDADVRPPADAPWPGRLAIATLGASHELTSDGPVHPTLAGRTVRRHLLRPGDSLGHGCYELKFVAAAGVTPAPRPAAPGRRQELNALLVLARRCHARVGTETLLEEVLECLLELCSARRGCVLLTKDEIEALGWEPGEPTLPVCVTGTSARFTVAVSRQMTGTGPDPVSRQVLQRVGSTGTSLLVPDVARDPATRASASLAVQGVRSVLAVPLKRAGQMVGLIYIDSLGSRRPLAIEDQQLLEGAAEHVVAALTSTAQQRRLEREARSARAVAHQESARHHDPTGLVVASSSMARVIDQLVRVAVQDTTVLLLGESGTGKELLARVLHQRSPRHAGPFVAVNCMAFAPDLVESELFGHEKGAFTGATAAHIGRFELAHGGTLFLDEVGELDPRVQVKLLRVLQEKTIERVGSGRSRAVDVRLVCATNADLKRAIAAGRFREDLYYRIAVFPIRIPPLRERPDDVPALVEHFLRDLSTRMGRVIGEVEPEALALFSRYPWPGNVRELRNVIERAFVLARSSVLTRAVLPDDLVQGVSPSAAPPAEPQEAPASRLTFAQALQEFERTLILGRLRDNDGNVARTSRDLDLPRSTLYRKLQEWGKLRRTGPGHGSADHDGATTGPSRRGQDPGSS
ncbi:MAG: sigma-54-dependent Fis family transcriptional regulator [Candidatus Riflebacteria bacterium]|nr:sigma-54-dependent Fis family transcriptional regulator [Candidatus Riflebacteria bacterium]